MKAESWLPVKDIVGDKSRLHSKPFPWAGGVNECYRLFISITRYNQVH
jgi:hypothetical protein